MADWYRDVDPGVGPDAYPEQTYRDWAQDAGAAATEETPGTP